MYLITKCMQQKMTELKGDIEKCTVVIGNSSLKELIENVAPSMLCTHPSKNQ